MKIQRLLLMLLAIMLVSMAYGQESIQQKFKKLGWLEGKWTRVNSKDGQSGYETWSTVSATKLKGKGVTLQGTKAIFTEELEFIIKDGKIYYTVIVSGEKRPTYFALTAVDKDSFVCENPTHDFPKKIAYKKIGNKVKAIVSGGGQEIVYDFVREK